MAYWAQVPGTISRPAWYAGTEFRDIVIRQSRRVTNVSARLWRWWSHLSLSKQFIIASSGVVITAMTVLGAWVSSQIVASVIQNTGLMTALYIDNLIEPQLQPLNDSQNLDPVAVAELDRLLTRSHRGRALAGIKIWNLNGTIIYSTNKDLVGLALPRDPGFQTARANKVAADFDVVEEAEAIAGHAIGSPVLEVYTPIHQYGTNKVIGVVELYQIANELAADIARIQRTTFLVVGTSTLCMLALLFRIVERGSRTIVTQQSALETQVADLSRLLDQNEELNNNVIASRKMATVTNERLLRRIGADLHDGPSQLIGLALLQYDNLDPAQNAATPQVRYERFEKIRGLLQDALGEIRNISSDIAPPLLGKLTFEGTIELVIRNHERRTGGVVERQIENVSAALDCNTKICLYRSVQEGLNNAYRHAQGCGVKVTAGRDNDALVVEISDRGPGFVADSNANSRGLGLAGLRDRIEACEGTLEVVSQPGAGTRLIARFALTEKTEFTKEEGQS